MGKNKKKASPLKKTASPLQQKKESRIPIALAFFLPFAAACVIFAFAGLSPFGDKTSLVFDGWKQYFPFFKAFREKLLSGGSLQYTWSVGMGTGYASLFAYYLASPLNWLCVLVPSSALTEFFALLTVIKVACAGGFFAIFLRIVYRRNDMSIAFFALLYAFCSWVSGYYWNNMWLDTFALLPLLIAGTVCLLRDGRFRLYIAALALSLWCNYYLSYFCGLFVFLSFIVYCIVCWQGWKNFLRRILRIGVSTLIAFGLVAVLLIPTLKAMMNSFSAAGAEFGAWELNLVEGDGGTVTGVWRAARRILANLLPDPSITEILPEGLPNIYCGFSAVVLAIFYCCCGRITLREKLCNLFLLGFLLLSFIFRKLDYLWHGFHFPNGLPYRFSFLFSFVTICMAYRAFTLMDCFKKWYLLIIVPVAGLFIWNAWGAEYGSVIAAVAVLAAVIAALLLYGERRARRVISAAILFAVIAAEAVSCFGFGVKQAVYTAKSDYPQDGAAMELLVEKTKELEGDNAFWRTEAYTTQPSATQVRNDGALYGYSGVSVFTSSANANFNRFSPTLGLSSLPACNWYVYTETTPFSDTMCGIKYLLDREKKNERSYDTLLASEGNVDLLRNDCFISAGFMTNSDLSEFSASERTDNPIRDQNELFALATGVQEPLHVSVPCDQAIAWQEGSTIEPVEDKQALFTYSTVGAAERTCFSLVYRIPSDGIYCATTRFPNLPTVYVYRNGEFLFEHYVTSRGMFCLGKLSAGDEIQLAYFVDPGWQGTISAEVSRMDDEAFQRGWAELADEPWELTEVSDTELSGTVTALRDGLFYTSIPYEPGWTATVDGEEVELAATFDPASERVNLTDAVIAFPLGAGTHTVTLRYRTPGLTAGAIISVVSLLTFGALLYLRRKEYTLLPDPSEADGEKTASNQEVTK